MNNIDSELLQIMAESDWLKIPYDELLENDPIAIRKRELELFNKENPLEKPSDLSVENQEIIYENHTVKLRIYYPKNKSNLPILLYFHGGAFIFGSPEQYDFIFYKLAIDAEMIIVSVDYQLAPENPFPSAIYDGYYALKWIQKKDNLTNGNKTKIIIGGSSAGGTIAMSITHLCRDLGNNAIHFQYLLYPPTDNRLQTNSMEKFATAPMQTRKSAKLMWKHYLGNKPNENLKYAVPLQENNFENLPPACIVVCEIDPLKDEGIAYAQKLKNAGVSVNLTEIKGAVHAFDFFPCKLSDDFYQKQISFFKKIFSN